MKRNANPNNVWYLGSNYFKFFLNRWGHLPAVFILKLTYKKNHQIGGFFIFVSIQLNTIRTDIPNQVPKPAHLVYMTNLFRKL